MLIIIGSAEEFHSKYVFNVLKERNIDVEYFDSRLYPSKIELSYTPDMEGYIKIDSRKIFLNDIQGVYWRWFYGVNYERIEDDFVSNMIFRERTSALHSLFCSLKCNWVNSYEAVELHKVKAYELNIMKENGIRIPKTLITNDKDALIEFYEDNDKNVIYKPVLGGAMTQKLTDDDLTNERLDELKSSPVQLQEFIDGTDIRIMVMGDEVFPAQIKASTIDFRADDNSEISAVEIPKEVEEDSVKVKNLLKLNYSGIDVRKSKNGEYVFIEANPAPMFYHFEKMTKYPITDKLIELLQKP